MYLLIYKYISIFVYRCTEHIDVCDSEHPQVAAATKSIAFSPSDGGVPALKPGLSPLVNSRATIRDLTCMAPSQLVVRVNPLGVDWGDSVLRNGKSLWISDTRSRHNPINSKHSSTPNEGGILTQGGGAIRVRTECGDDDKKCNAIRVKCLGLAKQTGSLCGMCSLLR